MLGKILKILSNQEKEQSSDIHAIFAGLLVRAAKIDNEYTDEEKLEIEKILSKKFNVSQEKSHVLRGLGEEIESNTTDTVQFTREIKKEIPFEKRKELAESLWSVILADKYRSDEENSFMRTCVRLIGINDIDSANARNAVISRNKEL